MGDKRRRAATVPNKGLGAGEKLNRQRLLAESDLRWNWIGTDVKHVSGITEQHCKRAAGLAFATPRRLCKNKYKTPYEPVKGNESLLEPDDAIIISDGEEDDPNCERKRCKDNPYCLNHLGQEKWEDEDKAEEAYLKSNLKLSNPESFSRAEGIPAGLKNLGATCYANAFLQVWFQDLTFRSGVYRCQPSYSNKQHFKDSPVFQLQVTFTALQEGNKAVYNPVKLVESLKLRTSEQQDAQEFSKLFMSHLDQEFKKQSNPELQTLLEDQFEGKIVNATVCDGCMTRSERMASFFELEVNLDKNAELEDRIRAILEPERLDENNKYSCSRCEGLQDATRLTEIHHLPPVLHISVLRFVYDHATLERKKSKLPLRFPPYLDMKPFVTSKKPNEGPGKETNNHVYELRGVLLHKGSSAYHGHYEAQVYSLSAKKWFQFNDETVSPLHSFHQESPSEDLGLLDGDSDGRPSKRQKRSAKGRRVEDSDDELFSQVPILKAGARKLSSRDAYMLIYARCDSPNASCLQPPTPPSDALNIVRAENMKHEGAIQVYKKRREELKTEFSRKRNIVMDVYRSWSLRFAKDPFYIASRWALEKWLIQPLNDSGHSDAWVDDIYTNASTSRESGSPPVDNVSPDGSLGMSSVTPRTDPWNIIDSRDLLCSHGRLNPLLDKDMKLMSEAGRQKLLEYGFHLKPELTENDICHTCVERVFIERLYQIEHPRIVDEFNSICRPDIDEEGFWISKHWVKDWQCTRPKMHTLQGDPPPDDPEFKAHVLCEHSNLTINANNRRRISFRSVMLLKQLYPEWDPPEWNAEPCSKCEVLLHLSRGNKMKQRKDADNEKKMFSRLYNSDHISGWRNIASDSTCILIPSEFIAAWKAWIDKPGDTARPQYITTEHLFCDCGLGGIRVDLSNMDDFNDDFSTVTEGEWENLSKLYEVGPKIEVSVGYALANGKDDTPDIFSFPSCCRRCRSECKLQFDSTILTIIRLNPQEVVPSSVSAIQEDLISSGNSMSTGRKSGAHSSVSDGFSIATSISRKAGSRSSQRIKESKYNRRKEIHVFKHTTVQTIKLELLNMFDIDYSEQHLYYNGEELVDGEKTVNELEIFDKATLYLKKADDTIVLDDDDDDNDELMIVGSVDRLENDAFQGTLLRGGPSSSPAYVEQSETATSPPATELTYSECTIREPSPL